MISTYYYPLKSKQEEREDGWSIWKDTVFDSIVLDDCANTVEGVCIQNVNLDECINKCDETKVMGQPGCVHGYYINTPDKNICVPLYTPLWWKYRNFSYNLENPKNYKIPSNYQITSFINTNLINFPPDDVKSIFYQDKMGLMYNNKNLNGNYMFKDDEKDILVLQPINIYNKYGTTKESIGNNSNVIFIKYKTSDTFGTKGLKFTKTKLLNIEKNDRKYIFTIQTKSGKDDLKYYDEFKLKYEKNGKEYYCTTNNKGEFMLTEEEKDGKYYKFIPYINTYKCVGKDCSQTSFENNKKDNNLYRRSGCFDQCNIKEDYITTENRVTNKENVFIIGILILTLTILFTC